MHVEQVQRTVDLDALDRVGNNLMFCDVTEDFPTADAGLLKIFRLAQLTMEYLLYTQNAIASENVALKKDYQALVTVRQCVAQPLNRLCSVGLRSNAMH